MNEKPLTDFTKAKLAIMLDLPDNEYRVLQAVFYNGDGRPMSWPYFAALANHSERHTRTIANSLRKKGLLTWETSPRKCGKNTPNVFKVNMDHFLQQVAARRQAIHERKLADLAAGRNDHHRPEGSRPKLRNTKGLLRGKQARVDLDIHPGWMYTASQVDGCVPPPVQTKDTERKQDQQVEIEGTGQIDYINLSKGVELEGKMTSNEEYLSILEAREIYDNYMKTGNLEPREVITTPAKVLNTGEIKTHTPPPPAGSPSPSPLSALPSSYPAAVSPYRRYYALRRRDADLWGVKDIMEGYMLSHGLTMEAAIAQADELEKAA